MIPFGGLLAEKRGNMAKLVSVIVPIYKVEPYLEKCVDSILAQTYPDLEVILVDDGSPDGCGDICERYAAQDARVRVVHKENGGLSSARNAGLDVATGDYVLFTDGDDWIEPEMVSVLVAAGTANDADVTTCNLRSESTSGEKKERVMDMQNVSLDFPKPDYPTLFKIHSRLFSIYSVNNLYVRAHIERMGLRFIPTQRVLSEDQLFNWCYYAAVRKAVYIDKSLYVYQVRENTLSREAKPADILNRRVTLVCELRDFLRKNIDALPPVSFFDSLTWSYFVSGCAALGSADRIVEGLRLIREKPERRRFRSTLLGMLFGKAGRQYVRAFGMDLHAKIYFKLMIVLMLLGRYDRPARTYLATSGG